MTAHTHTQLYTDTQKPAPIDTQTISHKYSNNHIYTGAIIDNHLHIGSTHR